MVTELTRWQDLDVKLSRAFSPATAINRHDLFRGRRAIIRRLIDAANQAGQHAIIYGERGVGKTSLANVLSDVLRPLTSETIASARFNCNRDTSYREVWQALFREVEVPIKDASSGLTVDNVFNTLRHAGPRKLILIIDEFDRIQDPDVDTLFADTIKTLSDFSLDTTLVLIGVADDVDDLITEHESIDRCLVQIQLPRMPFDELEEIVRSGIASVEMGISEDSVSKICTLSLGLPHYVHALGLASGRAAIDSHSMQVDTQHVDAAIDNLVSESQQTILHQFDLATASPRRENFYSQVLLACALAPTDTLGYFRAADVRDPCTRIMRRRMEIPSYVKHLRGLSDERRGEVLQRVGAARQYRFRFSDPLMQPYVLMRGLQKGLINMSDISRSSRAPSLQGSLDIGDT